MTKKKMSRKEERERLEFLNALHALRKIVELQRIVDFRMIEKFLERVRTEKGLEGLEELREEYKKI